MANTNVGQDSVQGRAADASPDVELVTRKSSEGWARGGPIPPPSITPSTDHTHASQEQRNPMDAHPYRQKHPRRTTIIVVVVGCSGRAARASSSRSVPCSRRRRPRRPPSRAVRRTPRTSRRRASRSPTPRQAPRSSARSTAARYAVCVSPKAYAGPFANGTHTFSVRADKTNTTVSSPASFGWRVDTVAPSLLSITRCRGQPREQRTAGVDRDLRRAGHAGSPLRTSAWSRAVSREPHRCSPASRRSARRRQRRGRSRSRPRARPRSTARSVSISFEVVGKGRRRKHAHRIGAGSGTDLRVPHRPHASTEADPHEDAYGRDRQDQRAVRLVRHRSRSALPVLARRHAFHVVLGVGARIQGPLGWHTLLRGRRARRRRERERSDHLLLDGHVVGRVHDQRWGEPTALPGRSATVARTSRSPTRTATRSR